MKNDEPISKKNQPQDKQTKRVVQRIRHDLKQIVDVVERAEESLLQLGFFLSRIEAMRAMTGDKRLSELEKLFLSIEKQRSRSRVPQLTSDLQHCIATTHNLIEFLESESELTHVSGQNPLIYCGIQEFAKQPLEIVNFGRLFREVFRKWKYITDKSLKDISYDGPPENQGPYLKTHAETLRDVLDNLASNAFKYAVSRSQIVASVRITNRSFIFMLTNESRCFEDDQEQFSIFNERTRGSNVGEEMGSGMGLFLARSYCEIYGGSLSLASPTTVDGKDGICRYTFEMTFPGTMVVAR